MPMAVFRCDASVQIGTGHVMRCLTLAGTLRAEGWQCHFICRDLPGNLLGRLEQAGFGIHALRAPLPGFVAPPRPVHAGWAGVPSARDAAETRDLLDRIGPDWLILDHYAFDADWQRAALPAGTRLMVWDDLADRPHICDVLLDQNAGRHPAHYAGLVPPACQSLTGPAYAVLRPEFAAARSGSLSGRADRPFRNLLIAVGGVDQPDVTGTCLAALADTPLHADFRIAIALGSAAPALDRLRAQAEAMPVRCDLHVDATDMARLMAQADLSIGGAGGTAWERCVLGLPALVVVMAENQLPAATALEGSGAALVLGKPDTPGLAARISDALRALSESDKLHAMSRAASRLVDGRGAARVGAALSGTAPA